MVSERFRRKRWSPARNCAEETIGARAIIRLSAISQAGTGRVWRVVRCNGSSALALAADHHFQKLPTVDDPGVLVRLGEIFGVACDNVVGVGGVSAFVKAIV